MPVGSRDFYEVLGVDRNATEDNLRKAYRSLAKKWHPDRHQGRDKAKAETRFKEINEAYDVLSDSDKRAKYDRFGPLFQNIGAAGGRGPTPGDFEGFSGFGPFGARRGKGAFEAGEGSEGFNKVLEDLFEELFHRGGARGAAKQAPAAQGEVELTLEDANKGGHKRLSMSQSSPCPVCGGDRTMRGQLCQACGGLGFRATERQIDVKFPKGVRDGVRLKVAGPDGDISLLVKLKKHAIFDLDGDDLRLDLPVLPHEAALGADVEVPTLEGAVRVTIPPGTSSGKTLRLRGKGLTRRDGSRGDLMARIMIAFNGMPSEEERRHYQDLARTGPASPRDELYRKARRAAG